MAKNLLTESLETAASAVELVSDTAARAREVFESFAALASSMRAGKTTSTIITRENLKDVIHAMETLHRAHAELASARDNLSRAVGAADAGPAGIDDSACAISTATSALSGAIGTLTRATNNLLAFASSPMEALQALETTISSAHAALGEAAVASAAESDGYLATLEAVEGANGIIKALQGSKVPTATIAAALDHTYRLATVTAALRYDIA